MSAFITDPYALTPIEEADGGVLLKRDDLFACEAEGMVVGGGKARACMLMSEGADALTCGSHRDSPQQAIVATVARRMGVPCVVHTATGKETDQQRFAMAAGAEIHRHYPGYNTVIMSRARVFSEANGHKLIPFGMESRHQLEGTAAQVANLPFGSFNRIVISMGIGMSLAGVLRGLAEHGVFLPVLGVSVGADPSKWTNKYIGGEWDGLVQIVKSGVPYSTKVPGRIATAVLDEIYEAKVQQFLQPGDLFWVVGVRPCLPEEGQA